MKKHIILTLSLLTFAILLMTLGSHDLFPHLIPFVFAHCDTMDGPVIKDAKKALDTGNVKLVLPWVQKKDEAEITKAFNDTLEVRKLGLKAKENSDMYFFETLVRIHRAGEGAPYAGIKPAGTSVEPGIEMADKAIETGSIDTLAKEVSDVVVSGIRERFKHAMEKKKHASESVEAGREYVEAYVTFIHYVEKLHIDAEGKGGNHED